MNKVNVVFVVLFLIFNACTMSSTKKASKSKVNRSMPLLPIEESNEKSFKDSSKLRLGGVGKSIEAYSDKVFVKRD
ncbi:MAG: hypothetical protein IT221_09215 [Fluviicola sp.]|nr:hypothetical protein [Fluviicola sp.]